MVTTYCADPHPTEPELHCNRARRNHEKHSAYSLEQEKYVDWPNEAYIEPEKVAKKRAQRESRIVLKEIAERVRRAD